MDDARGKHAHDLPDQRRVMGQRGFLRELDVVEPRRHVAFRIGDELHQHHAVREGVGLRHAHAGRREPVERVHLHALPRLLLHLAAEARALGHRARVPAVPGVAPFPVQRSLPEVAPGRVLVDLRAAHFVAAPDGVDDRLLAAHELPQHRVDEAFADERLEPLGSPHGGGQCLALPRGWNSAGVADARMPPEGA